ncbi:MAG: hypothetical protein H8D45_20680 [Bacteroidetes bacterium]|nr:hypothetical protein [Bacteroidota bacterium]
MNKNVIQEIKKECDNYKNTVWGLLAFINHSTWDFEREEKYPSAQHSLGRRMTTEEEKTVTPDLVVQRSPQYGLICEAKKDLVRDRELWVQYLDQLSDYDIIIEGWFDFDSVNNYDVVFLTDISRSVDFGDYIENSDRVFTHNLVTVGFQPTPGSTDTFITLKKERGNLSDTTLDESLRLVAEIPYSKIERSIGSVMFYDYPPHIVYTSRIIWEHICSAKISPDTWDKESKAHVLELSVDEITTELQEYFGQPSRGEREQEIPKQKWIRKVFDFLVEAEYAGKIDNIDTYKIF